MPVPVGGIPQISYQEIRKSALRFAGIDDDPGDFRFAMDLLVDVGPRVLARRALLKSDFTQILLKPCDGWILSNRSLFPDLSTCRGYLRLHFLNVA
jgi:hypothetical protein